MKLTAAQSLGAVKIKLTAASMFRRAARNHSSSNLEKAATSDFRLPINF
jgi:hypothetical protein